MANGEPDPGVLVIVSTVTEAPVKDAGVEAAGDDKTGVFDEEEGGVPEVPPAAADSCAKPMEGGSERSTV